MIIKFQEIWSDGKRQWTVSRTEKFDDKKSHMFRFLKNASKTKEHLKGLPSITGEATYFISHWQEFEDGLLKKAA